MNEWAENGEGSWLDDELAAQGLRDKRLVSRLRRLLDRFSSAPGQPVPAACGDWAATKAAYRFFDNPRVTEHGVLAGHFAATQARACDAKGPILVLQDTTEFHYKRDAPEKNWLYQDHQRRQLQGWTAECAHLVRDADALKPGCHHRRGASGFVGS